MKHTLPETVTQAFIDHEIERAIAQHRLEGAEAAALITWARWWQRDWLNPVDGYTPRSVRIMFDNYATFAQQAQDRRRI